MFKKKLCCLFISFSVYLSLVAVVPADKDVPYPHLFLGDPSGATATDLDNLLLKKHYFALSYNSSKGTPNWVSWRLTSAELGSAGRPPTFLSDITLPLGASIITTQDYQGGGFDRGHMCPHSDRNKDATMSRVTFVMTNVVPQSPHNNQRAWEALEAYSRGLVEKEGKILYIVCGPYGKGGTGTLGFKTSLKGKVTVPAKLWKVILAVDVDKDPYVGSSTGHLGPIELTENDARIIAVVTPNDQTPTREWAGYRVPLSEVEALSGLKFFTGLPDGILKNLRGEADETEIPDENSRR